MRWKPLVYKGKNLGDRFLISDEGEIYSLISKKKLKQTLNESTGYIGVVVSLGGRNKKILIKTHIAVAYTFVEGYKDGLVVNHKDGNKTNNNFKNLEWVTLKENSNHAVKNGLFLRSKKVRCLNNGMVFINIKEAAKWCGLNEKGGSIREYFINSNRKYAGKDPISGEKLRWEIVG